MQPVAILNTCSSGSKWQEEESCGFHYMGKGNFGQCVEKEFGWYTEECWLGVVWSRGEI